jgi:glyoxylase I family protein
MSHTARASITPTTMTILRRRHRASSSSSSSRVVVVRSQSVANAIEIQGVHHVAIICASLERSMDFYGRMLGLEINPERPEDKLPYRGAWLWIGPEMIHLMELPNPDSAHLEFRPTHGGRDRHFCIGVKKIQPLIECLEREGVAYTASKSGRPAIFFRDPDANTLEVVEGLEWRS